jgi:Ca2+/Na+ antiporter
MERRSIAAALGGSVVLLGLYLGIIALAQGVQHAFEQLTDDAPFVGLIAASGFMSGARLERARHRGDLSLSAAGQRATRARGHHGAGVTNHGR